MNDTSLLSTPQSPTLDAQSARILSLLNSGDVSKAKWLLDTTERLPESQTLRARVEERVHAPFKNFCAIAYPKLKADNGFASCLVELRRILDGRGLSRPVVVGVGGPAGAGKSHLIDELVLQLRARGFNQGRVHVVNQDRYFIPELASCPFSGHHIQARDWSSLIVDLKALRNLSHLDFVICHSNGAFLDLQATSLYDLTIGVFAHPPTLLARRCAALSTDSVEEFRQRFASKTSLDIERFTFPSLERHADFLVVSDSLPPKVFIRENAFADDVSTRERLIYALNSDPDGWDAIWQANHERFTGIPSWICTQGLTLSLPVKSVLEIGCGGSAKDAICFLRHGLHYSGIDISPTACTQACASIEAGGFHAVSALLADYSGPGLESSAAVICADTLDVIARLSSRGERFGIIHSYSSLHYLPPGLLSQALQGIRKICQGYFLLSLKDDQDRAYQMGQATLWHNARVYENRNKCDLRFSFTKNSVRQLLENHGFEVILQNEQPEDFDDAQSGAERYSRFINTIAIPV